MAIIYTDSVQYQWKHFSGFPNRPNFTTGNLPGFIDVPIKVRQEDSKTELGKKLNERVWSMDMWFGCTPIIQFGGHWAIQHLFYGGEFNNTMWLNEGQMPSQNYSSDFQGSHELGCMYKVTYPSSPAGGSMGWSWVRLEVQNFPKGNNWADLNNWNLPCDGKVATVRINTKWLYPGVYIFNTNAARDNFDKTYLRGFNQFGPHEIPLIHDPGFLIIHPPQEWIDQKLWKLQLGELRHVDPNNPFEPVPITTNLLLKLEAPLPFDPADGLDPNAVFPTR